ncbi:acyl-CoA carboxylase subunit epsilon (plasmid) [Streptomyces sp. NBC_01298]|uniref:acyl-CoA carboxylase subunit epsilon n=1 Tax=Streptomyces sp. NBC_01298 TaxID=2903817 RepID=UPI002E13C4AF|nr:acyl-CoA carboxylase subunit epsilon [Streptomyces sp. NBC_01298]
MGVPGGEKFALRIERGRASDEELAAVTVVLCSVLTGHGESRGEQEPSDVPSWRPERAVADYRSPYSWR